MLGMLPLGYIWVVIVLVAPMLGFACRAVRGFPSIAPCLEHVCAGGGRG